MKKTILLALSLALLCGWAFAGVSIDKDAGILNQRASGKLELSKQMEQPAGIKVTHVAPAADALISIAEVKPATGKVFFADARNTMHNSLPTTAAILFSDNFDDGNYTGWTNVSNGTGDGTEDWTCYADPWTYAYGEVENHGAGYLVGSDSDGGGAIADERLSHTFTTTGTGNLILQFWVHFRAYTPAAEYFEVLIDGTQVWLLTAANTTPIQGTAVVNINAYNNGASHTVTFHYYADYGYVGAFDDVYIANGPVNDNCAGIWDLGSGFGSVTGTTTGAANDYGPYPSQPACWQDAWYSLSCGGPDVVYKYTVPYTGTYNFDVCDAEWDADLTLYNYTCPTEPTYPANFICGADAQCGGPGSEYAAKIDCIELTEGQEIMIVVDGYGSAAGDFTLTISQCIPPSGACCVFQECVATNTIEECTALNGTWYGNEVCPTYVCPTDPMDCPPGTIFGQRPNGNNAGNSDIDGGYKIYDYIRVNGVVEDLHWWGIKGYFDGSEWVVCTEDPVAFEIVFYPDDGTGLPDLDNPLCTYNPTIAGFDTGELFGDQAIYRYDFVPNPVCNIALGAWVTINGNPGNDPNCWFLWHSSTDGDGMSLQQLIVSGDFNEIEYDMSICVTGTPVPVSGACCDMYLGVCEDAVDIQDCPVAYRFVPNTLCANLIPPCVQPLGACCIGMTCTATNTEYDCDLLSGTWYEGETCPDFPCGPCPEAVYQNGGPDGQSVSANQCDPYYPMAAGTADDFILPGTAPITIQSITAWTGHWNGPDVVTPANYEGIVVTIYANQPDSTPDEPGGKPIDGDPDCDHTALMPGGIIYSTVVNVYGYSEDPESTPAWDIWRIDLPVNVTLTGGVKYWLEIEPIVDFATWGQCGWHQTTNLTGDYSAQIFELLGTNEWTSNDGDVAFCLSDQPAVIYGSCCDQEGTGNCADNVLWTDCPSGYRFTPNVSCVLLHPPCGEELTGACCVDGVCVATNTEAQCDALTGQWFVDQTCPGHLCPRFQECPENTIFAQLPDGNTAATSEESQIQVVFDNYTVTDSICDIHWWGVTAFYDEVNGWTACTENPVQFFINFYADNGAGKPNLTAGPVCTYEAIVTGQDTYELFAGWPIWYYSVELDPCCQLPSGWVSIQGGSDPACWFLWHNSFDGDMAAWQYDESAEPDSQWSALAYDMSICLTTAETGPGCYEYLPGDVNMYSGNWPPAAIGGDVTYLVGRFRGVPTSVPCNFNGDLPAPFWASADANGDCNVIGSDVTKLVSVFRGIGSINYCGDQTGDAGHFEPCWHTPTELPPARPAGWPNCE